MMTTIEITQECWIAVAIRLVKDLDLIVPLRDTARISNFYMQYTDHDKVLLTFDQAADLTEFILRNSDLLA